MIGVSCVIETVRQAEKANLFSGTNDQETESNVDFTSVFTEYRFSQGSP